jgi:signal transduction histidine kinase
LKKLLENSLKYSSENSVVTFQLIEESNQIKFIIEDRGIGIPLADRDRL